VLLAAGQQDPLLILSGEVMAVEVVRSLVGSIGIVAAVPLTTAIAVLLVGRGARPPLQDAGQERSDTTTRTPG
jgi:uncharacterized membrane protein